VKPRIIVLVGLPASGKSTWARAQGLDILSTDETRRLLTGSEDDQTVHRQVFATLRYLLRQRVACGAILTCIDATSITVRERRQWIRQAELLDAEVEAVFFDTPLETCLARNSARARVVPPQAIQGMALRLSPPSTHEGFARVTVIRPS
jgi:predicted kinase